MEILKDRRLALPLLGGALALLAGVVVALLLVNKHKDETPPPAPAAQGGLVIDKASAL